MKWSVVGMASLLLFVQQASLLTVLYRISALRLVEMESPLWRALTFVFRRVILFTHFASFWVDVLIHHDSVSRILALRLRWRLTFFVPGAEDGYAHFGICLLFHV